MDWWDAPISRIMPFIDALPGLLAETRLSDAAVTSLPHMREQARRSMLSDWERTATEPVEQTRAAEPEVTDATNAAQRMDLLQQGIAVEIVDIDADGGGDDGA